MLKKNKHKIIIYLSVKLSKLVNSPLFRTSRYLDWLIKGHSGLYRARPPYTQVYRHLGLDLCQTSFTRWSRNRLLFPRGSQVSLGAPFKTLIAKSKRKEKKTDGGGWDDDKRKRRLTHYKVHVNATRECVKRRDPCIRATCADFSKGPPACQLWGFE